MSNEYLEEDVITALNRAIDTIDKENKSPLLIAPFRVLLIQETRKELKKIHY